MGKTGEVAELAEGGRLLSDCRGKTSTAGSNPALSALLSWLSDYSHCVSIDHLGYIRQLRQKLHN